MTLTREQMNERRKYGEWLSYHLSELGISCDELGTAIGLNERTVRRYANGETTPSPDSRAAIEEHIRLLSEYNGYKHIPSDIFAMLLESLLKEFKGVITQAQLAEHIGKRQKNISMYTCCAEKPDTKIQYDILRAFYRLCRPGGGISSAHFGTAAYLERLLYEEDADCFYGDDEPELGEQGSREAVEYIMSMPMRMQSFLLDNFGAFYDSTLAAETDFRTEFSFKHLSYGIELFRQLSELDKETVTAELERYSALRYPETNEDWAFFRHITSYRNVIYADMDKMRSDNEMLSGKNERIVVRHRIESLLNFSIAGDEEFVREVNFKLTMSSREWYVWMLFLIYDHRGQDLLLLCNDMIEMIHHPSKFDM
ncbi:MAG: helix-turn-helix transcriptional regulator [Oscillospiraceae bacterium]|nr:helix-turn-helix transcriptional regulator [Oscillospiraceae bacterium]